MSKRYVFILVLCAYAIYRFFMAMLEGFSGFKNPNVDNSSVQKLIIAQQVQNTLQTKIGLTPEKLAADMATLCKTKTANNSAEMEKCLAEQRQSYKNFEVIFTHMVTNKYKNYKTLSQLYNICIDNTIDTKITIVDWVAVKDCYYKELKNIDFKY